MAGNIMHKDALVGCDHPPGNATADLPDQNVLVSGMPVITVGSLYTITGCALTGTTSPACVTGAWTQGAQRVLVGGVPVAIDNGQSLCAASFGRLNPRVVQQRVQAS
jgi:uncharacterized Zn-binding protein involved in type VI secretion